MTPAISSTPLLEYGVYGFLLRSEFAIPLPEQVGSPLGTIEITLGSESFFQSEIAGLLLEDRSGWRRTARLADGSNYVHWQDLGEFLVSSDGCRITCRRFPEAAIESFQVYLLGQALGFALVQQGFEPLHATTLV